MLFLQIFLLIGGLVVVITGKITLSRKRVVEGAAARLIGVAFMMPLPLSYIVGFYIGLSLTKGGRPGEPVDLKSILPTLALLDLGVIVLCLVAAFVIMLCAGNTQQPRSSHGRRREAEGEDLELEPRPATVLPVPKPVVRNPAPSGAPTRTQCPSCQTIVGVLPSNLGQSVRCPKCQAAFVAQPAPGLVSIDCTQCGKQLQVPEKALGTKVCCPLCHTVIEARAREAPEPTHKEGIVPIEGAPQPRPLNPEVIPVVRAAPRAATLPHAAARRHAHAKTGTALPWILAGVSSAVALAALVVIIVLLARLNQGQADRGKADSKWDWKGDDPAWAKKDDDWKQPEEKKVAPPRPRFEDAAAQHITLKDGMFKTEIQFKDTDPFDRDMPFPVKLYLVKLEADRAYLIEIPPSAGGFKKPRLRLEDPEGRTMAADPDAPFKGRAKVLFLPRQTATYRVVVGDLSPDPGPFTLSVCEVKEGDPLPAEIELPNTEVPEQSIQLAKTIDRYLAAAIAPDSKSAWVAFPDGKLQHFACPAFKVLGTYQLPRPAYQLALDTRGILYAMVQLTKSQKSPFPGDQLKVADLHFYDTRKLPANGSALTPTKIIPIRGIVQHLLISPDDAWLYFLDTHNRKVGRIDLKEGKLAGENDQVVAGTNALCLTPNGKALYSCSNTNVVQKIDPATLKIEKTIRLDRRPSGIQASDSGYVFLSGSEGQWNHGYLLNANRDYKDATATVVPWADVSHLHSIRLSPDQKRFYTACMDAKIESYYVTERPALFRGQMCGSIRLGFNLLGHIEVSHDGNIMFCDCGAILLLGR